MSVRDKSGGNNFGAAIGAISGVVGDVVHRVRCMAQRRGFDLEPSSLDLGDFLPDRDHGVAKAIQLRLRFGFGLQRATEVAILNANYIAATSMRISRCSTAITEAASPMNASSIRGAKGFKRRHRRRYRQAADRLRLPCPDHELSGAGHTDDRTDQSESKAELDRFCDAMIAIRREIAEIESGRWKVEASPLRHAPHTVHDIADDAWARPYGRAEGCFPAGTSRADKYWSPGGTGRQCLWRPQSGLLVSAGRGLRTGGGVMRQIHRVPDAVQRPSRCTAEPGPSLGSEIMGPGSAAHQPHRGALRSIGAQSSVGEIFSNSIRQSNRANPDSVSRSKQSSKPVASASRNALAREPQG